MNSEQPYPPERARSLFEPTEAANSGIIHAYEIYSNPYERTGPYAQSPSPTPPPPPPPPQKTRKTWAGLVVLCLVGSLLVGSVIYVGINGAPWQTSHAATPAPAPTATPISTPSPVPTTTPLPSPTAHMPIITGAKAPYPASQIVASFYQAGLAPQTTSIDTGWSCCQYYPEGGAVYWQDPQTGITMDLATFATIDEAQIDSKNLADKGFGADVENYCLLSFGGTPSNLQSYVSVMAQACTYV